MTDPDADADESKIERLEKRIAELEKRQSRSALSRRSILAGVLGVGGLAAMGNVSAQQNQVGTIGTQNKRVDLFADTVDANQLTGSAGFIKTKTRAFLSSNSSADPVPLDSVTYDPDNNFDTTTHEYTVPATGTYLMTFQGRLEQSVSSGSRLALQLNKNGNTIVVAELNSDGVLSTISATDIRELASGDNIALGNVKNVELFGNEKSTFLTICQLE